MKDEPLKAPFIWFGGKRQVAGDIWSALGDVENYIEPFGGSLAVLLARNISPYARRTETVNDADGYIANFWRAVKSDPEQVAYYADDPINETDLLARHLWLVNTGRTRLIEGLESDPEWYDTKIAGWWVWGINAWIGSDWCAGNGPWKYGSEGDTVEYLSENEGAGQGVYRKLPHLGDAGQGVHRQRPHLNAGQGVHRKRPHLGDPGRGVKPWNTCAGRAERIIDYMLRLADRLRDVRVCAGDWGRVVTGGALSHGSSIGIFLDPPYSLSIRDNRCYNIDGLSLAVDVRNWAIANGENKRFRIVLAGYTEEHNTDIPASWRRIKWKGQAAYQTTKSSKTSGGNAENRHKEVLWCSPGCLSGHVQSEFVFGDNGGR
ncbi:MAG: DNA adenine methylase [Gammaproteobacteria bacterium]|nr:DNA adenine methylase [Gammaproteobacteria bacterium]MDH3375895.1 DNA adenine methylase [Gammaproteobacteria bacterium]